MKFYLFFFITMTTELFYNWLLANRGYSEKTVSNYKRTLKSFDKYLKKLSLGERGVNDCEDIKLFDIDSFIQQEKIKGKDVRTRNNYVACIKLYLRYCLILGKKVIDFRTILYAKEPKKKCRCLNDYEVKKLLKYYRSIKCKSEKDELIKTRNLCLATILVNTGLRVSEIANLTIKDIKENVQIIGKGGVRRVVYFFDEVRKLLDLYLFLRKDKSERLFISHSNNSDGKKLSTVSIEGIIREGAEMAGIDQKCFPHLLRHTFATKLLRENASIVHIQRLLGHKNLQTTQNYLTVLDTELENTQKLVNFV